MCTGIFTDKSKKPDDKDLSSALKKSCVWWIEIRNYILHNHSAAFEEWNYSKTTGWSARIKDSKRVIVYLMPQDKFFKASFVLGAKATGEAMKSSLSKDIIEIIKSAKVYAEGRGFRVDVVNKNMVKDIIKIIGIKLSN